MKKSILPVLLIIIFVVAVIGILLLVADNDKNDTPVVSDYQNNNSLETQDVIYLKDDNDIYKYTIDGETELIYQPDLKQNEYLHYNNPIENYVYAKINLAGFEEKLLKIDLLTGQEDLIYTSDTKFSFIVTKEKGIFINKENNQLINIDSVGKEDIIVNDLSQFDIEKSELFIPDSRMSLLDDGLINGKYLIFGGYNYAESILVDVTKKDDNAFVKKLPNMYFYRPLTAASDKNEFLYATYNEESEKEQLFHYSLISDKNNLLVSYFDGGMRTITYENNEILVDLSDFVDVGGNYYEAGQYIINSETQEIEKFDDICNIHNIFTGPYYSFSKDGDKVAWIDYEEDGNEKLIIADYNSVDCFSSLKEYDLPDNEYQWYLFDYQN